MKRTWEQVCVSDAPEWPWIIAKIASLPVMMICFALGVIAAAAFVVLQQMFDWATDGWDVVR